MSKYTHGFIQMYTSLYFHVFTEIEDKHKSTETVRSSIWRVSSDHFWRCRTWTRRRPSQTHSSEPVKNESLRRDSATFSALGAETPTGTGDNVFWIRKLNYIQTYRNPLNHTLGVWRSVVPSSLSTYPDLNSPDSRSRPKHYNFRHVKTICESVSSNSRN